MAFGSINVVVFYGNQLCNRFQNLLSFWAQMIPDTSWRQFVFLLLSDEMPSIPAEMTELLEQSCFWAKDTGKINPAEIVHTVMGKMVGPTTINLHCVYGLDEETAIPMDVPVRLADELYKQLELFSPALMQYILLNKQDNLHAAQKKLTLELTQKDNNAHVYLVGNVTAHGALMSNADVIHAVCCEILAHAAGMTHLNGKLYSLGYSTLNANNRELIKLRDHFVYKAIRETTHVGLTNEDAYRLLTGRTIDKWGDIGLRSRVDDWIDAIVENEKLVYSPTAKETEQAKIFACVYQRNPEELRNSISGFFTLNAGHPNQMRERANAAATRVILEAKRRLSLRLDLTSFPLMVLETICRELHEISKERVRMIPVQLPKKSFGTMFNKRKYIDECFEQYADARKQEIAQQYHALVAEALEQQVMTLEAFVTKAQAITDVLEDFRLTENELGLEDKYPKFRQEIAGALATNAMRVSSEVKENELCLTDSDGTPREGRIKELHARIAGIVESAMPAVYTGSFCKALAAECEDAHAMNNFFDKFLGAGSRMFHSIHAAINEDVSIYLADKVFTHNPWITNHSNVLFGKNDNIERLTRYPIVGSIEKMVDDPYSFYFRETEKNGDASGLVSLKGATKPTQLDFDVPEKKTIAEEVRPDESHGLRVVRGATGKYVLQWKWKPGETAAVITLQTEGRSESLIQNGVQYHSPVDGVLQGVDITDYLKTEEYVQVMIAYNGKKYAAGQIVGKQKTLRYKREMKDGKVKLTIQGAASDIAHAVIRQTEAGRVTLYPLVAVDVPQEYEGISTTGHLEIIASPLDKYPYIHAIEG